MKKILCILLLLFCILSVSGCGNQAELSALQQENEELRQQLDKFPKERPIVQRNDEIEKLQHEHDVISSLIDNNPDQSLDLLDILSNNLERQKTIMDGVGNEKPLDTLSKECEALIADYEKYTSEGNTEKASELEKQINILLYGNEEGTKTW